MILIHPARLDVRTFESAVTFASQMSAANYDVALLSESMPDEVSASFLQEASPYLREADAVTPEALVLIGMARAEDAAFSALRRVRFQDKARVLAPDVFPDRQTEIAARNKAAFATGLDAEVLNLDDHEGAVADGNGAPCFGVACPPRGRRNSDETRVLIFAPDLSDPALRASLQAMSLATDMPVLILTSGRQKVDWLDAFGPGAKIFGYSEFSAATFAGMADMIALLGPVGGNDRVQCIVNNVIASGRLVIDATMDGALLGAGVPAVRGPADPSHLGQHIRSSILPNRDGILGDQKNTTYAIGSRLDLALGGIGFPPPDAPTGTDDARKIAFMPTNGVGLGHAQRCALIAKEFDPPEGDIHFFAFPSCLPMLGRYGFHGTPLVARSPFHKAPNANDLLSALRLREGLGPGDTLVFDGGYVFPSVWRTIVERDLRSVWIRRGLWSTEQDNRGPLDREHLFDRIIVPGEAFGSLNRRYSSGKDVHEVGPIVQRLEAGVAPQVRERLATRFDRSFDKLVLTMPGGGVAADLTVHAQAVAAWAEGRDDVLHLILMWPGATVHPMLYGWSNTKVVETHHAGILAAAADTIVSAAGYNSFNEALYNRLPTIFIPQVASYMDDQTARAETAAEAGAALYVPADQPSQTGRQIARMIDGGQADNIQSALAGLDLPETGNADAARLISEVAS